MNKSYEYYADGKLKYIADSVNNKHDRFFGYSFTGQITEALTGAEARGGSDQLENLPYSQFISHNAFGQTTSNAQTAWTQSYGFSYSYQKNRVQTSGWTYDANGNLTKGQTLNYYYNAIGQTEKSATDLRENLSYFDGDGVEVKRVERSRENTSSSWTEYVKYMIRSSVTGNIISEVKSDGSKERSYVYAGGVKLAEQIYGSSSQEVVNWEHKDASGMSMRQTNVSGTTNVRRRMELDALGNNVGEQAPLNGNLNRGGAPESPFDNASIQLASSFGGCQLDGLPMDCARLNRLIQAGAVMTEEIVRNPNGTLQILRDNITYHGLGLFQYYKFKFASMNGDPIATPELRLGSMNVRKPDITPTLEDLQKAMNVCLHQLWRAKLEGLNPVAKGKNGYSRILYVNKDFFLQKETIYADTRSLSLVEMTVVKYMRKGGNITEEQALQEIASGRALAGFTATSPPDQLIYKGKTIKFGPNHTYIASDAEAIEGAHNMLLRWFGQHLTIQVHELGNAVDMLVGGDGYSKGDPLALDKDSGKTFGDCVQDQLIKQFIPR